ncbi:hypothetical protein GY45DRAFT_390985 [Cubamyces sp. BRFM 1775]|nr:hypothetical protein GY45DRAFT_390985 [Cubamyces sp. BRFM 1775]
MFNSSRSFILTLFSLTALFLGVALAAPFRGDYAVTGTHAHGHGHAHANANAKANAAQAAAAQNLTLSLTPRASLGKRYDNARFTYYDAGQNACGSYDDGNAYVIALSSEHYENGAHCYKQVTLEYNGKKVQATVTDECPGCNGAQADLSRPLFQALAPLDQGVIYGTWWFD